MARSRVRGLSVARHLSAICTDGQILFDTVRRFKGKQAPAVILANIDPEGARMAEALMVTCCGITRATVKLELIARRDNPWVIQTLGPAVADGS